MAPASETSSESMINRFLRLLQLLPVMFRARIEQARLEGRAIVRDLAMGTALAVVAVVLLALAVPLAVAMLVLLLAQAMAAWAATAIVLGIVVLVSAGLLWVARRKFRLRPVRFWRGMREDLEALAKQVGRLR